VLRSCAVLKKKGDDEKEDDEKEDDE